MRSRIARCCTITLCLAVAAIGCRLEDQSRASGGANTQSGDSRAWGDPPASAGDDSVSGDSQTPAGDNSSMFGGFDLEVTRYAGTNYPVLRDRPGTEDSRLFGGPHPGGCLFALCDGSVRSISYSIDDETLRRLANRDDGEVIDTSKL